MRVGYLFLVLLLGGCAALKEGHTSSGTDSTASASEVRCVKETSVGSRIGTTRCRTQRQIEQEEAAAQRVMDQIRSGANAPGANP